MPKKAAKIKQRPLSGPQQRFCEAYALDQNGTAAYMQAYPKSSREAARRSAADLLTKPDIKAEIARIRAKSEAMAGSAVLTLAEKRRFLADLVRTPVGAVDQDSPLCQEWTREEIDGGEEKPTVWKVKVKMPDKLRAMELDAKLAGELAADKAADKQAGAIGELADALNLIREATHGRKAG